jgi:hypothetical protein
MAQVQHRHRAPKAQEVHKAHKEAHKGAYEAPKVPGGDVPACHADADIATQAYWQGPEVCMWAAPDTQEHVWTAFLHAVDIAAMVPSMAVDVLHHLFLQVYSAVGPCSKLDAKRRNQLRAVADFLRDRAAAAFPPGSKDVQVAAAMVRAVYTGYRTSEGQATGQRQQGLDQEQAQWPDTDGGVRSAINTAGLQAFAQVCLATLSRNAPASSVRPDAATANAHAVQFVDTCARRRQVRRDLGTLHEASHHRSMLRAMHAAAAPTTDTWVLATRMAFRLAAQRCRPDALAAGRPYAFSLVPGKSPRYKVYRNGVLAGFIAPKPTATKMEFVVCDDADDAAISTDKGAAVARYDAAAHAHFMADVCTFTLSALMDGSRFRLVTCPPVLLTRPAGCAIVQCVTNVTAQGPVAKAVGLVFTKDWTDVPPCRLVSLALHELRTNIMYLEEAWAAVATVTGIYPQAILNSE